MPFVAELADHRRVDITNYPTPKLQLNGLELHCPYCPSNFTIVSTENVTRHFRHYARCTDPVAEAYFSGETESHRKAKRFLKSLFVDHLKNYTKTTPELEVRDSVCNRIADLMISYPFGYRQAIEVQLSRVNAENIISRTASYFEGGIDVIWFLGPNCRDERVRDYLKGQIGFYHFIDCSDDSFAISAAYHYLVENEFRSYSTPDGGEYSSLWSHMIRLAIIRYLQFYRYGFSPDFVKAILGTTRAEALFGGTMKSLKEHGAVVGEKYELPNQRWPINLWKITSPENAAAWVTDRRIKPMRQRAKRAIMSRSNHKPVLPSGAG